MHSNIPRSAGLALATVALAAACTGRDAAESGDSTTPAAARADSTVGTVAADAAPASTQPGAPNAEMQAVLGKLATLGGQPIETLTPAQARQQPTPADAVTALLKDGGKPTAPTALVPGVTSADRSIPGAAGQIPARVYTPDGAGPFPVIVYYHGGGFVIADKNVYDGGARGLAKAANAVVVSVDYRRAPEHKFPAQHDDALAASRWVSQNAASLKGDPERLSLAGESAGGNLAVATAVAVRDAKLPAPKHVIAVYPVAQTDTTTASYTTYADAKPLNRPMMGWFVKHTVRSEADLKDPRLNLIGANLRGLPPVTIVNAEIDPLRDDGAMLEKALKDAGVEVERRNYAGVAHEFFGMGAAVPQAKEAQEWAGGKIK